MRASIHDSFRLPRRCRIHRSDVNESTAGLLRRTPFRATATVLSWSANNVCGQTKRTSVNAMQVSIKDMGAVLGNGCIGAKSVLHCSWQQECRGESHLGIKSPASKSCISHPARLRRRTRLSRSHCERVSSLYPP